MTYEQMIIEARSWTPEQREAQLKELMTSPYFPAMAALLDYYDRDFAASAASPKTALHHGALAHANGAKYGVEIIQNTLRGIFNQAATKRKSKDS